MGNLVVCKQARAVRRGSVSRAGPRGIPARPQGIPARPSGVRRNTHLLWAAVRNFARRGSVAICVGFSGNPEKYPRFSDQPAGRFCGEGARFRGVPARPHGVRRNTHLLGAIGRNYAPRGSVAQCVGFSGNPEKSPRLDGPPTGRFFGEWARFRGAPIRPSGARRNTHFLGEIGCDLAPRRSVAKCVGFSGNPEKSP